VAEFRIGTPIETTEPSIEVTVNPQNPLPIGSHRFQLVVVDDSGNPSESAEVRVIVRDSQNPTAVIDAPSQVEYGQSFPLSGRRSSDVPPGRVVRWIWTLME
jgi:hypothetical protein